MRKPAGWRRLMPALRSYFIFFTLTGFIITCCLLLFLHTISIETGVSYTESGISLAAKLTFLNAMLLSLLFTVIDGIRRRFMVDRPVRCIIQASERLTKGDFSVRLKSFRDSAGMQGWNEIIYNFNRMAQELSGMETLRTDFVANVSHELKTPLAVLRNYAVLLQEPCLPEEQRLVYAQEMDRTAQRLAGLVTNILRLNKLENQRIYPNRTRLDLGEQLCACLLDFEDEWEKKHLELQTSLEPSVWLEADPELLALVWNNLISNAVKFTPPGGCIALTLTADGENAVVTVADTGIGISREVGAHIFEKFYQGDSSHAPQGNGLGLALVRRVIDIVGGSISVESEPGKGSRFTVRIRRCTDETAENYSA